MVFLWFSYGSSLPVDPSPSPIDPSWSPLIPAAWPIGIQIERQQQQRHGTRHDASKKLGFVSHGDVLEKTTYSYSML